MLAVIMLLGAGISAQNRNPIGWMVLGLCFPLVGIIVITYRQSELPAPDGDRIAAAADAGGLEAEIRA